MTDSTHRTDPHARNQDKRELPPVKPIIFGVEALPLLEILALMRAERIAAEAAARVGSSAGGRHGS
jgi:hypothetical protein